MRTLTVAIVAVLSGVIVIDGSPAAPWAGQGGNAHHAVTKDQYEGWKKELSNWGRWGKDDEIGTMNLITPVTRRQAVALVREGVSVSLAQDPVFDKALDNATPYERVMTITGPAAPWGAGVDYFNVQYHGFAHSHLDALGHMLSDGKFYNGFTAVEFMTKENGTAKGSIHNLKNGILARGILMDFPMLKGVPYLELGTRIYPEDFDAWEKKAGIRVGPGDVLILRTGRWARRTKVGAWDPKKATAGVDASVIPWLKRRDIAMLASDLAIDARPGPDLGPVWPVHDFVMIFLGVHVLDNLNPEELSTAAAARKRWEFLFTAAPIPVPGGTGSPINPIATF